MVPVDIPKPILLEYQFKADHQADHQHDQFLVDQKSTKLKIPSMPELLDNRRIVEPISVGRL
ncbi:MAG: hypothetical protein F6K44_16035 [Moorea sp. SIO3E2]|nr:hypothetical protein [Moorena sp. SIO3E2]NES41532.1 hypothetical protein [Moorena sp. SIO2C4]